MEYFQLNTNNIIILVLIIVPFVGLLSGESRLKRMTFAAFVGIVLSQALTPIIYDLLARFNWSFLTEQRLALAVFLLTLLLLNMGPLPHHETSKRFSFRILILAGLLSALLVSTTLLFLPSDLKNSLLSESTVLSFFDSTRIIWISACAAWLVVLNIWPQKDLKK